MSEATHSTLPETLDGKVLVVRGRSERGAVARYNRASGHAFGVKWFTDFAVAKARWRAEAHAAAAGLAPPIHSPLRRVVRKRSGRQVPVGWGYFVRHAAMIPQNVPEFLIDRQRARIGRLAREARLTTPTDIRRDNLGIIDRRVVLIDWGSDNLPAGRVVESGWKR